MIANSVLAADEFVSDSASERAHLGERGEGRDNLPSFNFPFLYNQKHFYTSRFIMHTILSSI